MRQSDLLSPMLFILAMKTLQEMMTAAHQELFQVLGAPTELL
jgi:hypothetical protein